MKGRPCKYGERVDGKCPPKPKTTQIKPKTNQTKTKKITRPCKYGERVNGKCPPKPKNVSVKKSLPVPTQVKHTNTKKIEHGEKNGENLIISHDQIYRVGDNHYFKIKIGNVIYRDINVIIEKNSAYTLTPIAKLLGVNTNIKKSELVDILKNRLQFEQSKDTPDVVNIEVVMYENGHKKTFDGFSGQELQSINDYLASMLKIDDSDIYYTWDDKEEMFIKNIKYNNKMIGNTSTKYPLNEKIPAKLKQYGLSKWGKVEFMFKLV